jgi:hypothetical protein
MARDSMATDTPFAFSSGTLFATFEPAEGHTQPSLPPFKQVHPLRRHIAFPVAEQNRLFLTPLTISLLIAPRSVHYSWNDPLSCDGPPLVDQSIVIPVRRFFCVVREMVQHYLPAREIREKPTVRKELSGAMFSEGGMRGLREVGFLEVSK